MQKAETLMESCRRGRSRYDTGIIQNVYNNGLRGVVCVPVVCVCLGIMVEKEAEQSKKGEEAHAEEEERENKCRGCV